MQRSGARQSLQIDCPQGHLPEDFVPRNDIGGQNDKRGKCVSHENMIKYVYKEYMRYSRYLLSLLLVPVLLFTAKSYAKTISDDNIAQVPQKVQPFVLEEKRPDGNTIEVSGTSGSRKLSEIVDDLDIILYPEDKLSVFPDLYMEMGGKITLLRAPKINVLDGKKKTLYRSWAGNVEDFLTEKNIILGADDKISPALETELKDATEIKINRVAKTTVIDKKLIDFKIINKDDPDLKYGKTRVDTGSKGEKELKYMVTRIDGEEVSRVLLDSNITKQVKDEIHYTGTKVTVISSVRGRVTMTPVSGYVVSSTYPRGTIIRISTNGVSIIEKVNATWGTASPPAGVIMDLAPSFLSRLKCPSHGCSSVLVEEIE